MECDAFNGAIVAAIILEFPFFFTRTDWSAQKMVKELHCTFLLTRLNKLLVTVSHDDVWPLYTIHLIRYLLDDLSLWSMKDIHTSLKQC